MCLVFYPDKHRYESVDLFEKINWLSASKIAGLFKPPFDAIDKSQKASKNKKSKWFGIPPEEIQRIWQAENLRSTTLGTWYHEKEEERLNGLNTLFYDNKELPIIRSIWENEVKIAPDQKLVDGIYTEHLTYVKSAGVCGQFDRIDVCNGFVDIDDFKSNKDLKKPAYVNWEGKVERMCSPLAHLENTKLVEYGIQLSLGMYMILRHNPQLKARNLLLHHITFELDGEDKYGYPITRLDENKEPIIKDVEKISLPYMKREVEIIFEFLKKKNGNKVI